MTPPAPPPAPPPALTPTPTATHHDKAIERLILAKAAAAAADARRPRGPAARALADARRERVERELRRTGRVKDPVLLSPRARAAREAADPAEVAARAADFASPSPGDERELTRSPFERGVGPLSSLEQLGPLPASTRVINF